MRVTQTLDVKSLDLIAKLFICDWEVLPIPRSHIANSLICVLVRTILRLNNISIVLFKYTNECSFHFFI